jgi:hypothetical protein
LERLLELAVFFNGEIARRRKETIMNTKKMLLGRAMVAALLCAAPLTVSAQTYDPDWDTPFAHTMSLWSVPDAADRIDYATVQTPSGSYAGEVRDVRIDFDGRPTRIGIALRDGNWVWVDAADLRYDPEHHLLISNLSYDELQDMST